MKGRFVIDRSWDGLPAEGAEVATLDWTVAGAQLTVRVDAPFHADPPPPGAAGRTERLWQYEAAELFLVGPDERYFELELGPHGHWLALRLEGVRRVVRDDVAVDYAAAISGSRWSGRARVARSGLALPLERANAFAVHGTGTGRRYLTAHPVGGAEPDFHRIHLFPRISRE
jgi:hypothetical protein